MGSKLPRSPVEENPLTKKGLSHTDPSEIDFSLSGEIETIISNQRMVELLATQFNPLRTEESSGVSEEDLYRFHTNASLRSFQHYVVIDQLGTVNSPQHVQRATEDSLFIDDSPSIDDVNQGGISDCYFMAALTNIAANDPGHLLKSIHRNGETIAIDFFTYEPTTKQWSPITIKMNDDLLTSDGKIKGAKYRFSPTPDYSEWFADVDSELLSVWRHDYHSAALWAPYLEKAYTLYVKKYGRYGGYRKELNSDEVFDYDRIKDGHITLLYSVFYGNQAQSPEVLELDIKAGPNGNERAILGLAQLGKKEKAASKHMLSVGTSYDVAWEKLAEEMRFFKGRFPDTELDLAIEAFCEIWDARDPKKFDVKNPSTELNDQIRRVSNASKMPQTGYANGIQSLVELCLMILRSSRDGQFIRPFHSYAVLEATFQTSKGEVIPGRELVSDHQRISDIDLAQSTIQLRNPWGFYEPTDPYKKENGEDDGVFNLSLETYLRVFESQRQVMITPT